MLNSCIELLTLYGMLESLAGGQSQMQLSPN